MDTFSMNILSKDYSDLFYSYYSQHYLAELLLV